MKSTSEEKKRALVGRRDDGCSTWPYVVILPLAVGPLAMRTCLDQVFLAAGKEGGLQGMARGEYRKDEERERCDTRGPRERRDRDRDENPFTTRHSCG